MIVLKFINQIKALYCQMQIVSCRGVEPVTKLLLVLVLVLLFKDGFKDIQKSKTHKKVRHRHRCKMRQPIAQLAFGVEETRAKAGLTTAQLVPLCVCVWGSGRVHGFFHTVWSACRGGEELRSGGSEKGDGGSEDGEPEERWLNTAAAGPSTSFNLPSPFSLASVPTLCQGSAGA